MTPRPQDLVIFVTTELIALLLAHVRGVISLVSRYTIVFNITNRNTSTLKRLGLDLGDEATYNTRGGHSHRCRVQSCDRGQDF